MPGKLAEGKTVLITGSSKGVGQEVAVRLALEGARLFLLAAPGSESELKETEQNCKSEGAPSVECQLCDLADPQAVQKAAEQLAGKGIDVAILNAGTFLGGENDPTKGNPDEWDRMMKINALAPMRLIRALAPKMCDKGSGHIICIGDVEAVHSGPTHAAYAASKYALRGFCKSSYEALRQKGVKVMNVAAGNVAGTGMDQKHGGQGAISPQDVAEAVMLAFHVSPNCVPEEIVLKAAQPGTAS